VVLACWYGIITSSVLRNKNKYDFSNNRAWHSKFSLSLYFSLNQSTPWFKKSPDFDEYRWMPVAIWINSSKKSVKTSDSTTAKFCSSVEFFNPDARYRIHHHIIQYLSVWTIARILHFVDIVSPASTWAHPLLNINALHGYRFLPKIYSLESIISLQHFHNSMRPWSTSFISEVLFDHLSLEHIRSSLTNTCGGGKEWRTE
jgi:hypothetical protein